MICPAASTPPNLRDRATPKHVVFLCAGAARQADGAKAVFLASTATYMAYANYRVMNRSNLYEMYLGQLPELVESDLFLNTRPEYGDFALCPA